MSLGNNAPILSLVDIKVVVLYLLAVITFVVLSFVKRPYVMFGFLSLITIAAIVVNFILWLKKKERRGENTKGF